MDEPSLLDTWVFDKVKEFLKNVSAITSQDSYEDTLRLKDKTIFFLHLLGMDMSGHINKPNSKKFNETLKKLDEGLGEIVEIVGKSFPDQETCFLFTSDHGMTDWGSHGAGSMHETHTPFLVWGPPIVVKALNGITTATTTINQVDITPFMSCLLGVPIPRNSIGQLPLGLLNSAERENECLLVNALQLGRQYIFWHEKLLSQTNTLFFTEFPHHHSYVWLSSMSTTVMNQSSTTTLLRKSRIQILKAMEDIKSGITYYKNYHRSTLKLCFLVNFIAWTLYISTSTTLTHRDTNTDRLRKINQKLLSRSFKFSMVAPLIPVIFIVTTYLRMITAPWRYYIYFMTPPLLIQRSFKWSRLSGGVGRFITSRRPIIWPDIYASFVLISQILALAIAIILPFYERKFAVLLLTYHFLIFITSGKFQSTPKNDKHFFKGKEYVARNAFAVVSLIPFYFLNVPGRYPVSLTLQLIAFVFLNRSPLLCVLKKFVRILANSLLLIPPSKNGHRHNFGALEICVVFMTLYCLVACRLDHRISVSRIVTVNAPSWVLVFLSCYIISMCYYYKSRPPRSYHDFDYDHRRDLILMERIGLAICSTFALTSVSYEYLYFALFITVLSEWKKNYYNINNNCHLLSNNVESHNHFSGPTLSPQSSKQRPFIIAATFQYLALAHCAFFGIGNVVTLNSFDPAYCTCLVNIFNPTLMALIIIVKSALPILLATAYFQHILQNLSARTLARATDTDRGEQVFSTVESDRLADALIILTLEIVSAYFFFQVRTEGSWLDIGLSLTHYIFCNVFLLLVTLCRAVTRRWVSSSRQNLPPASFNKYL